MTNNNTTKENIMKNFNVLAIDPITNRECTFEMVPSDQLRQNEHGETVFFYNDHYPDCEVISAVEVPQEKIDSMLSYFSQYGTDNE